METGIYLSLPQRDMELFKDIAKKMGWRYNTKEDLLLKYINRRPRGVDISDSEIMAEVRSVRYSE